MPLMGEPDPACFEFEFFLGSASSDILLKSQLEITEKLPGERRVSEPTSAFGS